MVYILYAQVIWAIGASMIFLSLLIFCFKQNYLAIFTIGCTLIFGHNLFDDFTSTSNILWNFLHVKAYITVIENKILIRSSYSLLPFFGLLALGYSLGSMLYSQNMAEKLRKKYFLIFALSALFLFIILRYFNIYGEQNLFTQGILSFLNTTKYPASLQFLLMTLSVAFLILSFSIKETLIAKIIAKYGAASLFFYILHLVIIASLYNILHAANVQINKLAAIYLISLIIVIFAYYPVIKFIDFRKSNIKQHKWLSYI